MTELTVHMELGKLVAERPVRSSVLERHGIDYCCGGKRTVQDACRDKGIDASALLAEITAADSESTADGPDPAAMTMTELADHIEEVHHAHLRSELPRLHDLIEKVNSAHGRAHPWLAEVRTTYGALVAELMSHMMKEEQVLFPVIRELDRAEIAPSFHCGSVANPIRVMEHEHDSAGDALRRLRTLTSDYRAPEGACNSFRALMDRLAALEGDMHIHIHKENNILFPRAARTEQRLTAQSVN